jgi:hypothetical protein
MRCGCNNNPTCPLNPRPPAPASPRPKRGNKPDGHRAISELQRVSQNNVINQRWTVPTGDPKAAWVIVVPVEGVPKTGVRLDAC